MAVDIKLTDIVFLYLPTIYFLGNLTEREIIALNPTEASNQ